ncbi:MAG TPA: hypothetical protein VGE29_18375 [Prosthecobacter sp.]
MTIAPNTDEVLHDTANDFRALGAAVKQDLHDLRQNATASLDECTRHAREDARNKVESLREFTVQNPFRALGYAALGGVLLGLYLRR